MLSQVVINQGNFALQNRAENVVQTVVHCFSIISSNKLIINKITPLSQSPLGSQITPSKWGKSLKINHFQRFFCSPMWAKIGISEQSAVYKSGTDSKKYILFTELSATIWYYISYRQTTCSKTGQISPLFAIWVQTPLLKWENCWNLTGWKFRPHSIENYPRIKMKLSIGIGFIVPFFRFPVTG